MSSKFKKLNLKDKIDLAQPNRTKRNILMSKAVTEPVKKIEKRNFATNLKIEI